MPEQINMKGRYGVVPSGSVYIGRQIPRLGFAPQQMGRPRRTRVKVIAKYRDYLLFNPRLMAALPELRGKDLACWCWPEPCHGEVLLELANS
jgi:hypothetical protein